MHAVENTPGLATCCRVLTQSQDLILAIACRSELGMRIKGFNAELVTPLIIEVTRESIKADTAVQGRADSLHWHVQIRSFTLSGSQLFFLWLSCTLLLCLGVMPEGMRIL
jgi:hypothetical protein